MTPTSSLLSFSPSVFMGIRALSCLWWFDCQLGERASLSVHGVNQAWYLPATPERLLTPTPQQGRGDGVRFCSISVVLSVVVFICVVVPLLTAPSIILVYFLVWQVNQNYFFCLSNKMFQCEKGKYWVFVSKTSPEWFYMKPGRGMGRRPRKNWWYFVEDPEKLDKSWN